jgi:molybdate transport system substrate-binding protein
MLMQIKAGSGVNVVMSDKGTLDETSQGVEFDRFESLGSTLLVLAWRKGLELKSPEDLGKPEVKSVCHPDSKSAIYGRAASRFLESSGIGGKIADKLSIVSSVPQVFAYLASGEMDAGFVNRVMVLNGGDKVGGWIEIADGYPSLNMVAAVVKGYGNDPQVQDFLKFLQSDPGKAILKKNGIW